jgi:hypothetical protein
MGGFICLGLQASPKGRLPRCFAKLCIHTVHLVERILFCNIVG